MILRGVVTWYVTGRTTMKAFFHLSLLCTFFTFRLVLFSKNFELVFSETTPEKDASLTSSDKATTSSKGSSKKESSIRKGKTRKKTRNSQLPDSSTSNMAIFRRKHHRVQHLPQETPLAIWFHRVQHLGHLPQET
ncbi:unnamed protein product [Amoebophrya sp. A120]|nr:unnamed protein product [Amoebophrya sp. A120]|eukprot:GSA120T00016529001.1